METLINRKGHSKGFTLIEILVTLAIIAVLAGISIPLYNRFILKAYDAELASDAKNSYTAAQAWFSDNPNGTIDTMAKLAIGGYRASANISLSSGTMTKTTGSIVLVSTSAVDTLNVATISFDGNITIAP